MEILQFVEERQGNLQPKVLADKLREMKAKLNVQEYGEVNLDLRVWGEGHQKPVEHSSEQNLSADGTNSEAIKQVPRFNSEKQRQVSIYINQTCESHQKEEEAGQESLRLSADPNNATLKKLISEFNSHGDELNAKLSGP